MLRMVAYYIVSLVATMEPQFSENYERLALKINVLLCLWTVKITSIEAVKFYTERIKQIVLITVRRDYNSFFFL